MRLKRDADPYVYGSTNDLLDSRGQHRRIEAAHPQRMRAWVFRQGIVSGTAAMRPATTQPRRNLAQGDAYVLQVRREKRFCDCANESAPNAFAL
jgi:hypothetical protein